MLASASRRDNTDRSLDWSLDICRKLWIYLNSCLRPEGPGKLSPGFTLGFGYNTLGPEGAPADDAPTNPSRNAGAPSGLITLKRVTRVNPGLGSPDPSGHRNHAQHLEN
jgi:hypothetical protein